MNESNADKDFFALGTAKYKSGDYEGAINFYRKSIATKEDWYSYHCLAWALFRQNNMKESRIIFEKSISLNEYWNSYNGLGWALFNSTLFSKAIDAFRKSLKLKENINAFRGLGWSLFRTKQYSEAIVAFRKTLRYEGSDENEILSIYRQLADSYDLINKKSSSLRTWNIYFSYSGLINKIDPFIGLERTYEQIESNKLEQITYNFLDNGFEFSPSYQIADDSSLKEWRHILYLHIPKCAGTSFEQPLRILSKLLYKLQPKGFTNDLIDNYIVPEPIRSKYEVQVLRKKIEFSTPNKIKSTFISCHGVSWNPLSSSISKAIENAPKVLVLSRNPKQRLLSQVRHEAFNYESIDKLIDYIEENTSKKNSELNNIMYKYIFDVGLNAIESKTELEKRQILPNDLDDMAFVDISDVSSKMKIRSAYLSASRLPNVFQYSKLNDSLSRGKKLVKQLNEDEIKYAFNRCIELGFVEKDEAIDFDCLHKRTLSKINNFSFDNEHISNIHPLTFILSKESIGSIVPTKMFLENPSMFYEN